jgi:aspartate 1-decarboxylase
MPEELHFFILYPKQGILHLHYSLSRKFPNFASSMMIHILKSKLHRVRVTEANLNYVGSITIDEDLMEAGNLLENEKVQVVNVSNGERLETYVIKGERGSGIICLNGPAARKALVDDLVIVVSYAIMSPEEAKTYKPIVVYPDSKTNKLKR